MSVELHRLRALSSSDAAGDDDTAESAVETGVARIALSPREFARAIGLSHPTIYKLIREGMPVLRVTPACQRIVPAEALAWMRSRGGDQ